MKKKILIIITILFLTTTLGVFAVSNFAYSENTEKTKATCNPDTCPPNGKKGVKAEYIRMQIPIPGVTHTCTYHPDPEANELKPCYYVEANLPLYIKKIYNFAIGVIAIIAVVMIMIGGLQWIFAAGNPGTISQAKSNITAAVSGLILALASYVILNTINPSLVELKMQMPEEIAGINQPDSELWCKNLPEDSVGEKIEGPDCFLINDGDKGCCGAIYKVLEDGKETDRICRGNGGCNSGERCLPIFGSTYACQDPQALCLNDNYGECEDRDRLLLNSAISNKDKAWGCGRLNLSDPLFGDKALKDKCYLQPVLVCNTAAGYTQVSCRTKDAEGVCWTAKQGTKVKFDANYLGTKEVVISCVEPNERGLRYQNYLCCYNPNAKIKYIRSWDWWNCAEMGKDNPDYRIDTCADYKRKYECETDPCGRALGKCRWNEHLNECRDVSP